MSNIYIIISYLCQIIPQNKPTYVIIITIGSDHMNNVNLWSSLQKDKYLYFKDIPTFISYLKEHNILLEFNIKNTYNTDNEPTNFLEVAASKQNINLTLTDKEHPILVDPLSIIPIYIDPTFYKENLNTLIKYTKEYLAYCIKNNKIIEIPDYIYEDNLIENIIKEYNIDISKEELLNRRYYYYEITKPLPKEAITKIKDNHLEFTIIKNNESTKISTKMVVSFYTIKDLKEKKYILLTPPMTDEEISNFIYINDNAIIKISPSSFESYDELSYFNYISNLIEKLSTHNKSYNIELRVNQRSVLEKSLLLKNVPKNINIIIKNDLHTYDLSTYIEEEKKLDSLVEPIKSSSLSPLEKYLAVYNIVKNFKPYKENIEHPEQARYLRYILDNEYIVCVGYSSLLKNLLDKVGIDNLTISVSVDTSYDNGFTKDNTILDYKGHARNIIRINDPKYNINGIYLADATWDNSKGQNNDLYLNSLMTFDRKKEASRLEKLNNYDLLFDFHDFKDFSQKLNYYLNTNVKKSYGNGYIDKIIKTYKNLFKEIITILNELDHDKYLYFMNKYYQKLSNYNMTIEVIEPLICNFLTEYAEYIIPLSNNNIKLSTILLAANVVKKEIDNLTPLEEFDWLDSTTKDNYKKENTSFPYNYDPTNSTEAFLEIKDISSSLNKTK